MIKIIDKHRARLIVSVTIDGKRTRHTKTVEYKGKRDLQSQYDAFEDEVKETPQTELTVSELVSAYINKKVLLGIKPTTEKGYRTCENRLQSLSQGILAKSLTTYRLDKIIAQMALKYSPKTINSTIALLSAAYDDAIRIGLLTENPCRNATLPKQKKREITIMSEEYVWKFFDALQGERLDYRVGYELCLLCGLRRSEVLGLRECDVDIKQNYVKVSQTRHRVNGEDKIQDTKNTTSYRTLALPEVVAKHIEELIAEHHAFPYEASEYLIQDGFGAWLNPSTFTNHIYKIEEQSGLPRVGVHGLRHTFASMLNSEGIDIARISAELGHSNINTTLSIYTHVFSEASVSSRGIAKALDDKIKSSGTFGAHEAK